MWKMVNKRKKKHSAAPQKTKTVSEETMIESMARDDLTDLTRKRSLREAVQLLRSQKKQTHIVDAVVQTLEKANTSNETIVENLHLSRHIRNHLSKEEVRDLQLIFTFFDSDNSGTIEQEELRKAFKILGFKISTAEAQRMMAEIDVETSGSIRFSEFLEFVISKLADTRDIHSEIMFAFKLLDEDEDGLITFDDLRRASQDLMLGFTKQELMDMIAEGDRKGDNTVNCDEFIDIMLRTNLFA